MSRILSLLVFVNFISGFKLVGATILTCPEGSSLVARTENKVPIEACAKRLLPCPQNDAIEVIPGSREANGACRIPHGKTVYRNPDGSELVMTYAFGKLEGKTTRYSSQKKILSEENFLNGYKTGLQRSFFSNGKKQSEERFVFNKKHGEQVSWYSNGELEKRVFYEAGKPSKDWTFWYRNGEKRSEVTYGANGWEGLYRDWYSNGKLHLAAQYVNGQLEGTYTVYSKDGKKLSERRYAKGILDGVFEEWDPTGEKIAASRYLQGKFIAWVDPRQSQNLDSEHEVKRTYASVTCAPNGSTSCLKADLDGNGYTDEILTSSEFEGKTLVRFNERGKVMKEVLIPAVGLEVYSARSNEGQFGEPATPRDGLVVWGNGAKTKLYLYDFESESFELTEYSSDFDL
jgi:antitoxin component YwqK of YwqJK toxin-antitoxin module